MFNSGRSLLFTLFNLLALFTTLALAAPLKAPHALGALDGHLPKGVVPLDKRYDNARFTYYDVGQNACGSYDSESDYLYNNGAHCYKTVTIQYKGKQVQAKVTDECPGCSEAQADLSRPLFKHLASLDEGVIYGQWWFN
ncbi:hypothetical protein C8Q80DRAFT_1120548 [Daedaleopsis nitida]|nr:hypothetical protein C8Q80DRAFT_1120548 [Daedaleopsis nitida]